MPHESVAGILFLIQNPAFSCHCDVLFCGWVLGALHRRSEHGGSLGGLEIKPTGWRRAGGGWGGAWDSDLFYANTGRKRIEGNSEMGRRKTAEVILITKSNNADLCWQLKGGWLITAPAPLQTQKNLFKHGKPTNHQRIRAWQWQRAVQPRNR